MKFLIELSQPEAVAPYPSPEKCFGILGAPFSLLDVTDDGCT
jgi:hypothetical protein